MAALKARVEKLEGKPVGEYDTGWVDPAGSHLVTKQEYDAFNVWVDSLPD